MNLGIIKLGAVICSHIGAMRIVNCIIKSNVPRSFLASFNFCVGVASFGLASAAGEVAAKSVCKDIDTIHSLIAKEPGEVKSEET